MSLTEGMVLTQGKGISIPKLEYTSVRLLDFFLRLKGVYIQS